MQRKAQQKGKVDLQLKKNPHLAGPKSKKFKFTKSEDTQLYNLVKLYGENDWRTIADQMPYRTPRQCRERWTNYVNPGLNKKPWSISEDMCLLMKHHDFGNKWKIIQRFFPGRSKNDIKQRIKHISNNMNKEPSYQNQQSLSPIQVPIQLSSSSPSCEELSSLNTEPCVQIEQNYSTSYSTYYEVPSYESAQSHSALQIQSDKNSFNGIRKSLESPKPSIPKQKIYLLNIENLWPPTLQLPVLEAR
ncbi:hypothetical protein M9Y10_008580 [Tritrichomonas musculus]|uniref:Myb-like DNA-binding domain containing protein n=1 Tax=Tritrichomonas musculus TaxID=1915356 RepID=A0ABR2IYJ3_9EUKA